MPREWNDIIGSNDYYQQDDFKGAAYQLITSQILYETNKQQAFAYRLIDRYRDAFRETFHLLGMELKFDSTHRFVAAIPYVEKQKNMSIADALLLLVLRKCYHLKAMQAELENGSAVMAIEEFLEVYRNETGRELPSEVRLLKDLLGRMKAYGVVKTPPTEPGSDQPFDVAILSGIEAIVNEKTLERLSIYTGATRGDTPGLEEDDESVVLATDGESSEEA